MIHFINMTNDTSLGELPSTVSYTFSRILGKLLSKGVIILITLYILFQLFDCFLFHGRNIVTITIKYFGTQNTDVL